MALNRARVSYGSHIVHLSSIKADKPAAVCLHLLMSRPLWPSTGRLRVLMGRQHSVEFQGWPAAVCRKQHLSVRKLFQALARYFFLSNLENSQVHWNASALLSRPNVARSCSYTLMISENVEKVCIARTLKQGLCGRFPPALKIKWVFDEQLN